MPTGDLWAFVSALQSFSRKNSSHSAYCIFKEYSVNTSGDSLLRKTSADTLPPDEHTSR